MRTNNAMIGLVEHLLIQSLPVLVYHQVVNNWHYLQQWLLQSTTILISCLCIESLSKKQVLFLLIMLVVADPLVCTVGIFQIHLQ